MKDNKIISIFIVGQNNRLQLISAFDSLLQQDSDKFEIIFRDNKSTDGSYELAIEYSIKFKEKNIFMSVSENKDLMNISDIQRIMRRESEGAFFYYMFPTVALDSKFVSTVTDLFNHNEISAIIFPPKLHFCEKSGIVNAESLVKDIMCSDINCNEIVYNRLFEITYSSNIEIFLGYDHLYRLFIYMFMGDVYYSNDKLIVHSDTQDNEEILENLMYSIEKYRLIIAMKRKSKIYNKQNIIPPQSFIRESLINGANTAKNIMFSKGKDVIAKKYDQLALLYEII